jgi:hypothetical protein
VSRETSISAETQADARSLLERIRAHINDARTLVLELYERKGWLALGYNSWRECVVAEFDQSKSHLYRLLDAARAERFLFRRIDVREKRERVARRPADCPLKKEKGSCAQRGAGPGGDGLDSFRSDPATFRKTPAGLLSGRSKEAGSEDELGDSRCGVLRDIGRKELATYKLVRGFAIVCRRHSQAADVAIGHNADNARIVLDRHGESADNDMIRMRDLD